MELMERYLVLIRLIQTLREKVYRAWTDAEMRKPWFVPLPVWSGAGRPMGYGGRPVGGADCSGGAGLSPFADEFLETPDHCEHGV